MATHLQPVPDTSWYMAHHASLDRQQSFHEPRGAFEIGDGDMLVRRVDLFVSNAETDGRNTVHAEDIDIRPAAGLDEARLKAGSMGSTPAELYDRRVFAQLDR